MLKGKKGIIVEALMRIVIAVVLLFIVYKIGIKIGHSLFGQSDMEESFTNLVAEIQNLKSGTQRQLFVSLDNGAAVVGFSKNIGEFRCNDCGSGSAGVSSYFKKPAKEECDKKSCVCLCSPLQIDKSKSPYELSCGKILCKTLNDDIAGSIEFKDYIKELEKKEPGKYSFLLNAKWTGGFLFERHTRGDFVASGLPSPSMRRFTIYVKKSSANEYELCPGTSCTYTSASQVASQPGQQIPGNICNIMFECANGINIGSQSRSSCNSYTTIFLNVEDDCKKVKECVDKQVKVKGTCEQAGAWYTLTYTS